MQHVLVLFTGKCSASTHTGSVRTRMTNKPCKPSQCEILHIFRIEVTPFYWVLGFSASHILFTSAHTRLTAWFSRRASRDLKASLT